MTIDEYRSRSDELGDELLAGSATAIGRRTASCTPTTSMPATLRPLVARQRCRCRRRGRRGVRPSARGHRTWQRAAPHVPGVPVRGLRHECGRIAHARGRACGPAATTGSSSRHGDDHAATVAEAAVVRGLRRAAGGHPDILLLTAVDELAPGEIAPRLDADGRRCRHERYAPGPLASAYLAQHGVPAGARPRPACLETGSALAAYVRGGVGARRRALVEEHLAECEDCAVEHADLDRLNGHLRPAATMPLLVWLRTAAESVRSAVSAGFNVVTAPLSASSMLAATSFGVAILPMPGAPRPESA